jgi:hypothetical protein
MGLCGDPMALSIMALLIAHSLSSSFKGTAWRFRHVFARIGHCIRVAFSTTSSVIVPFPNGRSLADGARVWYRIAMRLQ